MSRRWPIEIISGPGVAAGAVVACQGARRSVTLVVKAGFALVHEGVMAAAQAPEIVLDDRHLEGDPARSLDAAGELSPALARCDVLLRGHAYAQKGRPAVASTARLALFRDGSPLLDKTVHVYGDSDASMQDARSAQARGAPAGNRRPFTRMPLVYERAHGGAGVDDNPAGSASPNLIHPRDPRLPAGFGPIARRWPARRRLLDNLGAGLGEPGADGVIHLPANVAWAGFQAAPADQQVDALRGGEWLVLDGLHPTLPRVQTRLPFVRGAARVMIGGGGLARAIPVDLAADMLVVDSDAGLAALVFRGRYEIADAGTALSSITALCAVEYPDRPAPWAVLAAQAGHASSAASVTSAPAGTREDVTQTLDPKAFEVRDRVVPFAGAALPGSGPASLPRSDTPWGPPSFRAPPGFSRTAPGDDETTVPLPGHAGNRAFDLDPGPAPSDHRWIEEPPRLGPLAGAAPEKPIDAPEAPAMLAVPAKPAVPETPAAPPAPTIDTTALRKKAGRGKLSADDVAAFARAFALPPARGPS